MMRHGDFASAAAASTLSPLAPPFTLDRRLHPAAAAFYPAATGDGAEGCGWDWTIDVEQRSGEAGSFLLPRGDGSSRRGAIQEEGISSDHPLTPNTTSHSLLAPTHNPITPDSRNKPSSDHWPSSASCLASFNSSVSPIPSSDVIGTTPYYPYYNASAAADLESVVDLKDYGMNGVMWNGQFNGEKGGRPWMDHSSSYKSFSYHKGSTAADFMAYEDGSNPRHGKFDNSDKHHIKLQCTNWLDDELSTIFEGHSNTACKVTGASIYDSSAYLKGMTSPVPAPVANANGSPTLNSSYNRYITQMDSCSTAPTACYPSTSCSTSSQEYISSVRSSVPSEYSNMPAFTSSSKQHANSPESKDGYVGIVPAHHTKLLVSQEPEVQRGNAERSRASNNTSNNNSSLIDFSSMISDLPFGTDFPTGSSMEQSRDAKSGLRNVIIPNSFNSECVSTESNDSMQSFSGALDQINLAVDSPCWKGAPASRERPFAAVEMTAPHVILEDSKHCNAFNPDQKHRHLEANAEALSFLGQHESLICSEERKDTPLSPLKTRSLNFSSHCIHQKCDDQNMIESDHAKVNNEEQDKCLDMLEEKKNEDIKHQNNFVPEDFDLKQLGQEGNVASADELVSFSKISDLETGHKNEAQESSSDFNLCARADATCSSVSDVPVPCEIVQPPSSFGLLDNSSPLKIEVQLVVKAIHSLSEVLLSAYSSDPTEMKEHDQALLQLVIENLKASIPKSKDTVRAASHNSGPEVAQADMRIPDIDVRIHNKYKGRHDLEKNRDILCLNTDESRNSDPEGNDTFVWRSNGMAQALEKTLKVNYLEQEDDPQILLYKSLWIEAEAELCSMKYELQLLRMKQKMGTRVKESTRDFFDVASDHSLESNGPSCKDKISFCNDPNTGGNDAGKGICTEPNEEAPLSKTHKADEVDDSVMARFRILESRINSSRNFEAEEKFTSLVASRLKEDLYSPSTDSEGGAGLKHFTINPANVGFTKGNSQQLLPLDESRESSSEVKQRYELQNHGANFNEVVGQGLGTSGQVAGGLLHAYGPLIHSYAPGSHGKQNVAGGSNSSSSEWEHVQLEELKW